VIKNATSSGLKIINPKHWRKETPIHQNWHIISTKKPGHARKIHNGNRPFLLFNAHRNIQRKGLKQSLFPVCNKRRTSLYEACTKRYQMAIIMNLCSEEVQRKQSHNGAEWTWSAAIAVISKRFWVCVWGHMCGGWLVLLCIYVNLYSLCSEWTKPKFHVRGYRNVFVHPSQVATS
jgi:hypothetical protein